MIRRTIFNFRRGLATSVSNPLVIKNNTIETSIILSRSPQIIRDATPFEKAYFDYREKLERDESTTLPSEFYFKKGSVAERRWKHEEAARQAAMVDPSVSLSEAVESSQSIWEKENEGIVAAAKIEKKSRTTEADIKHDMKSLDRSLQNTLYLVVKESDKDQWHFPQGPVDTAEYLHEAAERTLRDRCGVDMDTWFVGRQPIGFYKDMNAVSKVFFMKARIFAGQVKPSKEISDFAWLTKEELPNYLSGDYYKAIKDSLSDI
ncbi:39S mitochondrial ribosomal protein L46-domain-containing protein [Pilobolus umbonatus]|nr:39S mitochondrial ribosomal protein L46-domain-containing protein [Pilobolus umbonatus]